jgi:ribosomal protein S18 acetylase RimI-like enzyme
MLIKPYETNHREPIVKLSLRAWEPVFESVRATFDRELYDHFWPDWRVSQRRDVEAACDDPDMQVWVAIDGDAVIGFVAVRLHAGDSMGEIYMIAVDPDAQRKGTGVELSHYACAWMREQNMTVAMAETGNDPGHGPARRTYEKAGFCPWHNVRYFKKL